MQFIDMEALMKANPHLDARAVQEAVDLHKRWLAAGIQPKPYRNVEPPGFGHVRVNDNAFRETFTLRST